MKINIYKKGFNIQEDDALFILWPEVMYNSL